jgi:hypothetical protein
VGGRVGPGHKRKSRQGIKILLSANFCEEVLPRLVRAGVRENPGAI